MLRGAAPASSPSPGETDQAHTRCTSAHTHTHTPAAFNTILSLTQFTADKNQECFITLSRERASAIYAIKHCMGGEQTDKKKKNYITLKWNFYRLKILIYKGYTRTHKTVLSGPQI